MVENHNMNKTDNTNNTEMVNNFSALRFIGFEMTKEDTFVIMNEILNEDSLDSFVQLVTQKECDLIIDEVNKVAEKENVIGHRINTYLLETIDKLNSDDVYFDMDTRRFYDSANIVSLLEIEREEIESGV